MSRKSPLHAGWVLLCLAACGPSNTADYTRVSPVPETDAKTTPARADAAVVRDTAPPSPPDAAVDAPLPQTPDVAPPPVDVAPPPPPDVAPPDLAPPDTMPPPLEIAKIPNIALWLDSTKGVTVSGDRVTKWEDQSPAGNHAVQNTAANRPRQATEAGAPVVRFTRKEVDYLVIADNEKLRFGTGDFSMLFVAANRGPISTGAQTSWSALYRRGISNTELVWMAFNWPGDCDVASGACPNDTTRIGFGTANINNANYIAPVSAKTGLNDGKLRLYVGRRIGQVLELRINGVVDKMATHSDNKNVDFAGRPSFIGAFDSTGDRILPFEGDIREAVLVKGTIDPDTFTRLEAQLMERHKLTP